MNLIINKMIWTKIKLYGFVLLILALLVQFFILKGTLTKLKVANNNNLSYEYNIGVYRDKLNNLHTSTIQLTKGFNDIKNSRDSIDKILYSTIKELNINKRKVKELGYIIDKINNEGVITIYDSIFKQLTDTCYAITNDQWNFGTVCFTDTSLNYNITTISENVLVFYDNKITKGEPKKTWIGRLFQKKQTVVQVDVSNKNPNVLEKNQRFTHILK